MTDLPSHLVDDCPNVEVGVGLLNSSLATLPACLQDEIMSTCLSTTLVQDSNTTISTNSTTSPVSHSFLLDESFVESLNFKEILQLFGCAISQEQAWAVLNQCLNELKYLLDTNIELIYLNQDTVDINSLNFTKDGTILFDFDHKPCTDSPLKLGNQQSLTPNTASNSIGWSSSTSSSSSIGRSFNIL